MILSGFIAGFISRLLISFLGGERFEGFVIVMFSSRAEQFEPIFLMGFFTSFIGFRLLSVPSNIMLPINPERDPISGTLINRLVAHGMGHVLVKQQVGIELFITLLVFIPCVILSPLFWNDDSGIKRILFALSFLGMIGVHYLHLWLRGTKTEEDAIYCVKYIIGIIVSAIFALTVIHVVQINGMVVLLTLVFFGGDGLSTKKIPEQLWDKRLPWGNWEFSNYSLVTGIVSGLMIGVPSSLAVNLTIEDHEPEIKRANDYLVGSSCSQLVSLATWIWYGSAKSSYAEALNQSNITVIGNYGAAIAFGTAVVICMIISATIIEQWSRLYLAVIRYTFKFVSLLLLAFSIISIFLMGVSPLVGFGIICLWLMYRLVYNSLELPKISQLSVLSSVPLISINWLKLLG